MSKVLIVIDMQRQYWASINLKMNRKIKKLIKEYKANKQPIVVVEYPSGKKPETHKWIRKILDGYSKKIEVVKDQIDGSEFIYKALTKKRIKPEEINLVGVNHSICVRSTSIGLASKYPNSKIKIIKSATNDLTLNFKIYSSQKHIETEIPYVEVID